MPAKSRLHKLYASLSDGCSVKRCPLFHQQGEFPPVPGEGPANAKIAFVGRNPGQRELHWQLPFRGRAGHRFDRVLDDAGLERKLCVITNLLKCYTIDNRPPTSDEISYCSTRWLEREIAALHRVKLLVTLGKEAERWALGYLASQGSSTVGGRSWPVHLAMVHPAAALRRPLFEALLRSQTKQLRALARRLGCES